jgi:hypothetical protein
MSAIELLSAKYNFNIEDAINVLNENKARSKSKSKVVEAKKEVEDLFAQIVNDVDDVIINNTDNTEVVIKDQAMMNSDDYNNDLQILINSIEKYPITLPEKMPAEYDGMSVKDAYLMARVKKEKEMKPAEKQLIRAVIKGANKYQKELEKEAEKAKKDAEKQALAEQKKAEKAALAAQKKAADPKEIEKQKKAAEKAAEKAKKDAEKAAAAELKKLEQEEAKKAKMVEKAKKEMEKKMTPENMKKEQEKMNKELEKQKKAAEKEIEKEKKEAEKKALAEQKKAAKEAEKLAKKKEPKAKAAKSVETKVEAKVEEAPVKVTVKRVKIAGQEYLKSSANILYNPETQEEVGMYDEVTNSIKPLPDDEEEELSEDNYDN